MLGLKEEVEAEKGMNAYVRKGRLCVYVENERKVSLMFLPEKSW
jgi:hypothetical protein